MCQFYFYILFLFFLFFLLYFLFFFFFCKQKTSYEMRISDWSSDVCSSDRRSIFNPMPCPDRRSIRLWPAAASVARTHPATLQFRRGERPPRTARLLLPSKR